MRILLTTNGGRLGEGVLRMGARLARSTEAAPTVLTVIKPQMGHHVDQTREILTHVQQALVAEGLEAQTKARVGDVVQEIVEEINEGNYDLVVVGEGQEARLVGRPLHRSVALRLVGRVPCSILVVKGIPRPLSRILLCESGAGTPELSEGSNPSVALRFATGLANLLQDDLEITVLHVMSQISAGPGVRGTQLRASAEELVGERAPEGAMLMQDVRLLERRGIHPHATVRHGLVVEEILEEARRGDYGLVVIGAHRGHNILLENLARKVIERLDRSVLVLA